MAATKYFFYSNEQLTLRRQVELRMGKKFKVGHVTVNGIKKPFTEMSSLPTSRYADAKLIISGDPDLLRYTEPRGE